MMTESNDYEWLLARERGEDVSHIPAETRAKYSQLDRLIKELPAHAPSPGWKQRVLDSLDDPLEARRPRAFPSATVRSPVATARSAPAPRRRWWWVFGPGLASAFGLVLALFVYGDEHGAPAVSRRAGIAERPAAAPASTGGDNQPTVLRLPARGDPPTAMIAVAVGVDGLLAAAPSVAVRRGPRPHRGIGDILVIDTVSDRPLELRAYGDSGEPLARCTEAEGCSVAREGGRRRVHFELELRSPGAVRTVAFAGGAMPTSFVNLDADLEAARLANTDVREISVVHVE
jgi:hypothetical protein